MRLLCLDRFRPSIIRVTVMVPKSKLALVQIWWVQCLRWSEFRNELLFKQPGVSVDETTSIEYIPRSPHAQTKYGGHIGLLTSMFQCTVFVKTVCGWVILRKVLSNFRSHFGACIISTQVATIHCNGVNLYRKYAAIR